MAAGYLDLLQRELRSAVIHPFASAAELAVAPGDEGQMASTEGSFYIRTGGAWRRILNEEDLALIEAELSRSAGMYEMVIPNGAIGSVQVPHGFSGRPLVQVSGPNGEGLEVSVVHDELLKSSMLDWSSPIPDGSKVSCVGSLDTAAP